MSLTHSAAAVAAFLVAAPLTPAAFAQEAITLETIGAVRMANPDELRGRDAAATDRGHRHDAALTGANPAIAR